MIISLLVRQTKTRLCQFVSSQNKEQNEARTRVLRPPAALGRLSHAEKEQSEERSREREKKGKSTDNSADSRRRDTAEQNGLIKLTQWRALKWSAGERRNGANKKKKEEEEGEGTEGDNGEGVKISMLINR